MREPSSIINHSYVADNTVASSSFRKAFINRWIQYWNKYKDIKNEEEKFPSIDSLFDDNRRKKFNLIVKYDNFKTNLNKERKFFRNINKEHNKEVKSKRKVLSLFDVNEDEKQKKRMKLKNKMKKTKSKIIAQIAKSEIHRCKRGKCIFNYPQHYFLTQNRNIKLRKFYSFNKKRTKFKKKHKTSNRKQQFPQFRHKKRIGKPLIVHSKNLKTRFKTRVKQSLVELKKNHENHDETFQDPKYKKLKTIEYIIVSLMMLFWILKSSTTGFVQKNKRTWWKKT
ncbi:uncharacterized protein LOC111622714 [Centruroides sculpturatus]|nr:uncharacterized protein LOC111622714 [Centruroides sculpturatus]